VLVARAYAKINRSLEILGKRSDGYHDLISVMQTIDLSDVLTFEESADLSLECSDPALPPDSNLVLRAAHALRVRYAVRRGCAIRLQKYIPVGGGLGGGSSDAACTLLSLCKLWHLTVSDVELGGVAAEIGSDVSFFLWGGTALVEGKGDRVTPILPVSLSWCILARPDASVSTSDAYRELVATEWTGGHVTQQLATNLARCRSWKVGMNGLQLAVFRLCPEVRACFEAVAALAPGRTLVSGSGAAVFALSPSQAEARRLSQALSELGYWSWSGRVLDPAGSCFQTLSRQRLEE
jgi:4-diphosphocytidyl-2-C-methyl-D-erythritol kinase